MEYRTAADLVTALGARVRDTASSKWSAVEKRAALQVACQSVVGYVLPAVYTGLTMADDTYGYELPARADRAYWVERRVSDENTAYEPLAWWSVAAHPETGAPYLWLDFDGADWSLRVHYGVPLPEPPAADTTINDTGVTTTSTEITLASVSGWPEPGWAKIGNEVLFYATIDAANSKITGINRAVWGTAAAHTNGSNVYAVVPAVTAGLYDVLLLLAEADLHRQMLNDAPASEREEHRWQLRWADQQAAGKMLTLPRFMLPTRIKLNPAVRTWKGQEENDWV